MPRLPPVNPVSGHYSNNLPGTSSPLSRHEADKHATDILKKKSTTSTSQEVDRIEEKYWHHRLISFCKNKINRLIHPPPSIKIRDLVDDLTENSPKKDVQKVLSALKLHTGRAIKLHQSADGKLGFTDGKVPVSTKTMEAVANSIKRNGVEMAYEYLRKGENLPAGYLQQILIPHIHKAILQAIRYENNSKTTLSHEQIEGRKEYRVNPEKYINDLLEKADIKDEKHFTFERILEFKKSIRNSIVKSVDEQKFSTHLKTPSHDKTIKQNQDLIDSPKLAIPEQTEHFIEKEDTRHIQKLSSGTSFFTKIHINDIGNRVKRTFLRNKRTHLFFMGGIIASIVITAIFPPAGISMGIALALSVILEAGYELFWASGSNLWRRVRLIKGLRQIKKYDDFDYTNLGPETDHKRKKLIQNLLYRCKHKTFSQIYNAYAELEKQADKLKNLAEKNQKTLSASIAFQKEKALYHERRKKLKSNLYFFDKLIEQITINRIVIEQRNQKDLELLWNERFTEMNPITRDVLFKKASKNLIVQGHQVRTSGKNWLSNILQHSPIRKFNTTEDDSQNPALEKAKTSKLFTSSGTLKTLIQATFLRSTKKTIFNNFISIGKVLRRNPIIMIHNPIAPKPDLTGTLVFFSFFFLEMATGNSNTKINQARVNEIKNKKKGHTWQLTGNRKRTGREEVATLRSQTKQEIEPMINHLLESAKSMEETGRILDDAKKRSKMLGKGLFGAMSDKNAAITLLKHAAWKNLLDKEINGTFSLFHNHIQEKASAWNNQIARTLIANSKQATTVSSVSDDQIYNRLAHSGQKGEINEATQQIPSEVFLVSIRNRVSGELIQRFRRGEISENKAIQEIGSLKNLDELLALQYWVDTALREENYQQHKDALKKFQKTINSIIINNH
ncbi:hypothetical protein [Endozoicomonas sp.]|uniref:hypothetical protein n=1 Tax=Endozoicomonas sp. TaxID=1892382 RepID=UPI00383B23A1